MVKCSECGFLALRTQTDWVSGEAPDYFRETGQPPGTISFLLCFARKIKIQQETDKLPKDSGGRGNRVLQIISAERECDSFAEWQQGFSPKEHREMLDRERLLKWQTEENRSNRRYRLIELALVFVTIVAVLLAAFIERSGQPTIIINTSDQSSVTQGIQSGEQSTPGSNAP